MIHAAAPCPVDVKHRMMKWFGPIIYEYYGGTRGIRRHNDRPAGVARPSWIGRQAVLPLRMWSVTDGTECAVGESGELYFEGGPAFEYFNDPEKTASVFQ